MEQQKHKWKGTKYAEIPTLIREEAFRSMEKTAVRTLILDIHWKKEAGLLKGKTPEEQYDDYCIHWLADKSYQKALLREFPELERLLEKQNSQMFLFALEIFQHLEKDKAEITELFCEGRSFDRIRSLEFTGDPHKDGRRTARVGLDNGTVLYYKSHGLKNCLRYQEVYRYFCEKAGVTYRGLQYLSRDTYGWEEQIQQKPCQTQEEVKRFYFRMGIHLLLGYALGATDLHGENVIAWGEYPVIIDMETYPGYLTQIKESSVKEKIETMLAGSVLHTGVLPVPTWGTGKNTILLGGLHTGKVATPFKMPVIKKAKTSEMYIDYEPITLEINKNEVKLREKKINGNTYAAELTQGFEAAYETLLSEKTPKMLLEGFFEGRSRAVLRHTQQYAMYQLVSWHPDYMAGWEDRKQLLSVIHKKDETEAESQIHDYEIQSLLENEIPYFELEGKSHSLIMGDERKIENYLPYTPYEAWQLHVKQLCRRDCQRQCDLIRLSMEMLGKESWSERKDRTAFQEIGGKLTTRVRMRTQIERIVEWLLERAVFAADGVNWMGLCFLENGYWKMAPSRMDFYDGISGIAVFLAEYCKVFSDKDVQKILEQVIRQMMGYTEKLEHSSKEEFRHTGLLEGEGSVVYGFLLLYQKTGNPSYLSYAERHFVSMERFFETDETYDYLSGNAGVIQAALLLREMTDRDFYLDKAVQLEKNLWSKAVQLESGTGWKLSHMERPLAGMAHGNSGFLMMYAKLYERTGDSSYQKKIQQLLAYERSLYSKEHGNWLDLRKTGEEPGVMNAWCHGAPGILLARLELETHLGEEMVAQDLEQAAAALFYGAEDGKICLCHGLAGRILIMREYLKRYKVPQRIQLYQEKIRLLLSMLEQRQNLYESELRNPGFMNGISGVGYALLKLYQEEKSLSDF